MTQPLQELPKEPDRGKSPLANNKFLVATRKMSENNSKNSFMDNLVQAFRSELYFHNWKDFISAKNKLIFIINNWLEAENNK